MDFINQFVAGLISAFRAKSPGVFALIAAIVFTAYGATVAFSTEIVAGVEPILQGGGLATVEAIKGALFAIATFLNISLSKIKKE